MRYDKEIAPNPAWQERYARLYGLFGELYRLSAPYYDLLDSVEGEIETTAGQLAGAQGES